MVRARLRHPNHVDNFNNENIDKAVGDRSVYGVVLVDNDGVVRTTAETPRSR